MRKKILVANWKMNHGVEETRKFFQEFNRYYVVRSNTEIVIAPSFLSIGESMRLNAKKVAISAQNMHWEEKGAFTGEVSVFMLKELGCQFVIIGHSERRHVFLETDAQIQKKVALAWKHDLGVILCVGETLVERENNQTFSVLDRQIESALKGIPIKDSVIPAKAEISSHLIIAYEPVWAIGTGKVATPDQAEQAHKHIRKMLWDLWGMKTASEIRILYGGSVQPENISELIHQPNIDGALVGGASLDPKSFIEIFKQMA